MTNNYISLAGAVELDEKMTRLRSLKPFTRCIQCSRSHYITNKYDERQFVCKKPHHRQVIIHPDDSITGCPFAQRHTNAEALSDAVLAALHKDEE